MRSPLVQRGVLGSGTMHRMKMTLAVLMAGAVLVPGCQSSWRLPDEGDPSVVQEEQRLAALLGTSDDVLGVPGGDCDVRLLGRDGETAYAWAHCESADAGSASVPVRVDGDSVRQPGDGAQYSDDVRALFPSRLADEILERPDRLRP